jgi:hypothetical protein
MMPTLDPNAVNIFQQGLNNNLGVNAMKQALGMQAPPPMVDPQEELRRKAQILALQNMANQPVLPQQQ